MVGRDGIELSIFAYLTAEGLILENHCAVGFGHLRTARNYCVAPLALGNHYDIGVDCLRV